MSGHIARIYWTVLSAHPLSERCLRTYIVLRKVSKGKLHFLVTINIFMEKYDFELSISVLEDLNDDRMAC